MHDAIGEPPPQYELCPTPPDLVRLFFKTTDGVHRQFMYFRGHGEDI
jgi:hypothetical protein